MDNKKKNELIQKSKEIQQDISNLKRKLNELNKQKESWFKKKSDLNKDVYSLIKGITGIKKQKDKFNKQIYEEKSKRDKYNNEVKKLITELKKLNEEKKEFFQKHGIKSDPTRLKEKIDSLELSIETDALSFNKEKKVMEQIKQLRKIYSASAGVTKIIEKINKLAKKLDEVRKKADESHQKLQKYVKENKEGYSEFITISKEINDVKGNQEGAFNMFIDFKKKFLEINTQLKEKIISLSGLQISLDSLKKESQIKKKFEQQQILKEKTRKVEEKLKAGKKLTTEDLLVFQNQKEE